MEVFPKISVIPVDNPIVEQINFKNIGVSFGKESQERKRREWDYPKRDITLKYTWIPKADALTLWDFYIARGGSYEAFYFFHPFTNIYEGEFVAISPGNETSFVLPSIGAANYTLYSDNVPLNEGSDYIFHYKGSVEGIDYIEMDPPDTGLIITWDFTGQLVSRCRFDSDTHDFETFNSQLSKVGIKLKGLLYSVQFSYASSEPVFFFDEFDDESIAPEWTGTANCTEGADGKMLIADPGTGVAELAQDNLVLEEQFFDIWARFSDFTKAGGADAWYTKQLVWTNFPRAEIGVYWDDSPGTWKIWFVAVNSSNQTSVGTYNLGASLPPKIWVRLKYQFGDTYVHAYWTATQPYGDSGWTEITTSPYHCDPEQSLANLEFRAVSVNAASFKMDYFRDTFLQLGNPTTTSTTTTTT